jgi:hypothetical protein
MKTKVKKPKYSKSQFELYMCESIDNIEKKLEKKRDVTKSVDTVLRMLGKHQEYYDEQKIGVVYDILLDLRNGVVTKTE